jgi:hypothetical protein
LQESGSLPGCREPEAKQGESERPQPLDRGNLEPRGRRPG